MAEVRFRSKADDVRQQDVGFSIKVRGFEPMRKATAANIALCLVAIGWLVSYWGVMAHLGDADPRVPREIIEAENRFYWGVFFGGAVLIVVAMWLAGFGYSEAKVRSIAVAAAIVIPLVALGVWMAIAL
ncbi:hypothetical protein [Dyella sp. Tek66A03]|uniref:hypothetical protein n=1 Tax=Dyella sp. Tek66A03 TaxID=3458298 RepID=UPI00403EEA71